MCYGLSEDAGRDINDVVFQGALEFGRAKSMPIAINLSNAVTFSQKTQELADCVMK
jgi:hypothetical protein